MAGSGEDALAVLEMFVNDVANLPAEIAHIYEEIAHKDAQLRPFLDTARAREASLHKHIRMHTSLEPHPKEAAYVEQIRRSQQRVRELQDEKVALAQKALELLDRHIKKLDAKIGELVRDGVMQPFNVTPAQNNLPARPMPVAQAAAGAVARVAAQAAQAAAGERQGTPGFRRPARERKKKEEEEEEGTEDKRLYCTCREVSYGSMVGCDDRDCPFEWFHWGCVGLTEEPVGKWYCPPCTERRAQARAGVKAARG